jgi:transcriptional regulator with XRE-family HTH domain
MAGVQISTREPSIATRARKLRLSCLLTQQELAVAAGVSKDEVNRLEHGLPLILDSKRKILKELWSKKAEKR